MKNQTMLEEIIEYCSKKGITAYELAKHLPLSQVALQGILDQKTKNPRLKNIQLIHDYLFNSGTQIPEPLERKTKTGYDLKIESTKAEIIELENLIKLLSQEINSVNEETALEFSAKIAAYKTKSRLLEEKIEIITIAKNNQKD